MRKQLHRVIQLADQKFSKAEKTEHLTDDMQVADKRAEQIKSALTGLLSKEKPSLGNNKNSESNSQDIEKRITKCPEYVLGQTMLKNSGGEGPMSYTLKSCGKAQMALATEIVEHKSKVDQYVITPLQQILDTDIPSISKHKKSLNNSILDMDILKGRYQKLNIGASTATKVDSLKDELEDAEAKVESMRDLLASDLFQLMSKETQLAQTILLYIKLQRAHFESALHCLEDVIPDLECFINNNEMKPVYNFSLEEHLRVTNRRIALPIQLCVCALLRVGMEEEGLFRVAGSATKLKRLKLSLDACCLTLRTALEYRDPHVIAGALKSYLRELPDPLLTSALYSEWVAAAKQTLTETRLQTLHTIIHKLPQANFENLRFLIKFFAKITKSQDINKMSPHNLAIVIAPNLLWNPSEDKTSIAMDTANYSSLIVEDMITYAEYFFPGEVDFDRDLESMIMELDEVTTNSSSMGLRRCKSNNSLNDLGDSPTQGSPKPATRRKKPAPIPPTPDKQPPQQPQHQQIPHHEYKRPDEKPPPRPLVTATLNRATYKSQKHDQVTAELLQPQVADKQDQTPSRVQPESQAQPQVPSHTRNSTQDPVSNNTVRASQIDKHFALESNKCSEDDVKPVGFDASRNESVKDVAIVSDASPQNQADNTSSANQDDHEKKNSDEERVNTGLIGFEMFGLKAVESNIDDVKPLKDSTMTESMEKLDSPKLKPIPAEKPPPTPTTLERRKPPVATPRYLTNANSATSNQPEDLVEIRKKPDVNNVASVDKTSKPAIPERPIGFPRPSSLIRGYPRQSIENLDSDFGPITTDRTQMSSIDKAQVSIQVVGANKTNGTISSANLQRSPSVGSRPTSMSVSATSTAHHQQQSNAVDRPNKPPRPDALPTEHVRAHSRTRSEGNIIDVQTQTQTIIVPRSAGYAQQQSTSPRSYQRLSRPQPPPPPPPTTTRPKSDNESTNL
ncbi:rho GTPase-activating protein 17 isoform X2 [Copidosoma floridanum]|nr:rho GTPase-activating protein 17 isoform X2 [Copidosoma floridanum]XP_014206010.1 rho GTPase-activating protein 17 isoform X2 [Copidosoma floridanum]